VNRAQRNRAARLARRVLVDGRLVAPLPPERHGLASSYSNHGCRCELCSQAGSAYWQDYAPYRARANSARRRAA
jgi:hypothetical protein